VVHAGGGSGIASAERDVSDGETIQELVRRINSFERHSALVATLSTLKAAEIIYCIVLLSSEKDPRLVFVVVDRILLKYESACLK
jgi:hypothetical protein